MVFGDVLKMDIFKDAKILAGKNGVDNLIENVSVLELPLTYDENFKVTEHNFYITGLFAYKDNLEDLINMFHLLQSENSSGICVIDYYFETLPEECIEYCNSVDFPVILISKNINYSHILSQMFQKIISSKDEKRNEVLINNILNRDFSEQVIRQNSKLLNINFREKHIVLFFSKDDSTEYINVDNIVKLKKCWHISMFGEGVLLILTFDEDDYSVESTISEVLETIKSKYRKTRIGVSEIKKSLNVINRSILEAITAHNSSSLLKKRTVHYNDLGVYTLLFHLKEDKALEKFKNQVLLPIIEYDIENNGKLLRTAEVFVGTNGDFKKTAKKLYIHINTARYRVEKISKILGFEEVGFAFYERLSLAVKAERVISGIIK